jgi:hypothetical protein
MRCSNWGDVGAVVAEQIAAGAQVAISQLGSLLFSLGLVLIT